MAPALRHHRSHDYGGLVRRWRAAARRLGLAARELDQVSGFTRIFFEPRRPVPGAPWLYFSAGIHGDETGATEGLLAWASANPDVFRRANALVFPCLNPWGLANNSRFDERGRDLNRLYKPGRGPAASHIAALAGRRFSLALTLHEDYDADGIYVYELAPRRAAWGRDILDAAAAIIPHDSRKTIERRRAQSGLVVRDLKPGQVEIHPEALYLHFYHASRTFTFETPSEFHLDTRVEAQVRCIDCAVGRTLG